MGIHARHVGWSMNLPRWQILALPVHQDGQAIRVRHEYSMARRVSSTLSARGQHGERRYSASLNPAGVSALLNQSSDLPNKGHPLENQNKTSTTNLSPPPVNRHGRSEFFVFLLIRPCRNLAVRAFVHRPAR
jgi:hypothetical protein